MRHELPKLEAHTPIPLTPAVLVKELKMPPSAYDLMPFGASHFVVPIGQSTPSHRHSAVEFWFIGDGRGEVDCGEHKVRVEPGDALYFAPNQSHAIHNDGERDLSIFSLWLCQPDRSR